jgi:hypothetical protein
VPKVWDEYKSEEFTMHAMLFTTISDNPLIATSLDRVKEKVQLAHTT